MKKFIPLFLALMFSFFLFTSSAAAVPTSEKEVWINTEFFGSFRTFSDLPTDGSEQAIIMAQALGIVKPDDTWRFRPHDFITQTEFAQMVSNAFGVKLTETADESATKEWIVEALFSVWHANNDEPTSANEWVAERGYTIEDPAALVTRAKACEILLCLCELS